METELIEGIAEIKRIGHACIGSMAWESFYIVFTVNGIDYKWHSDNIPFILQKLDKLDIDNHIKVGTFFDIKFRARENKVWRMLKLLYR